MVLSEICALPPQIVMQEVPTEISLAFVVLGCPHRCRDCHSKETWHKEGDPLTVESLTTHLMRYKGLISCVCFMGGDWLPDQLEPLLEASRALGLKTCLYAGVDSVSNRLIHLLDYIKLGAFDITKGGLSSPTTNQRLYKLPQWEPVYFYERITVGGE